MSLRLGALAVANAPLFNNPVYEEINLSTWLAANSASIVEANFDLTKGVVDYLLRKLVGFTNGRK